MVHELPDLEELKVLLKETNNIHWYKRVKFTGPPESVKYLKQKMKQLDILLDTGENNTEMSGSL